MSKYSLETLAVHRSIPEKSGSVQTPIHQTSSFVFENTEHAANLFALKEFGSIYSRLTNPTVDEYASRLANLHGAAGGFACSSGHAAQLLIFLNLLQSGDHIVASKYLYGGSVTQLTHTFPRQFGWQSTLVDINKLDKVKNAIQENTKALFIESQSNPSGVIADIKALAEYISKMPVKKNIKDSLTPLDEALKFGLPSIKEMPSNGSSLNSNFSSEV